MPRHASGPLERLEITSPCTADWDSMRGNDRVRFCEHCRLHVRDVSAMTPAQAFNLVLGSQGRLCLRVHRRPDGSAVTRGAPSPLHRIRRRVSRAAAGAFGAALGLSAAAAAQARPPALPATAEAPASAQPGAQAGGTVTLSGVVLSTQGVPLPAAFVTLIDERTDARRGAITNATGAYNIEGLAAGTYSIRILKPGYGSLQTQGVVLSDGDERRVDTVAEGDEEIAVVETVVMGGAAIVEPTEPLVKAVFDEDLAAVRRLLAGGADANAVDKGSGASALAQAVSKGNREIAVELLRAGADVNARLEYGHTALLRLTPETSEDVVLELLFAGAEVNARDEEGRTALMAAAGWGAPGVVELLLRAGAEVNAWDYRRDTALMYAARIGQTEHARALLSAGADIRLRNHEGSTALKLARDNEQTETADLLLAYGATDDGPEEQDEPRAETAARP